MIQLIEWENQDEFIPNFPKDFKREILIEKTFNSFVNMANWLDNHKEYANLVMISVNPKSNGLNGIRRVNFDARITCYVEGMGNI